MNIEGRIDIRQGGQVAPHKSVKPKPNPPEDHRGTLERAIAFFADLHRAADNGGCECGVSDWSLRHVAVNAYQDAVALQNPLGIVTSMRASR